jgi:hypothetical protein
MDGWMDGWKMDGRSIMTKLWMNLNGNNISYSLDWIGSSNKAAQIIN